MGWGIEEVMDRVMVGGGYRRDDGDGAPVAQASVSLLAVPEEKVWNGYDDVPGRSFFILGGTQGSCTDSGQCRLGGELGVGFVPGILGAFAGPKVGADYDFGDGHTRLNLGGELSFLDPASPLTELWAIDGKLMVDLNDHSIGFGIFLTVGGSVTKAIEHSH